MDKLKASIFVFLVLILGIASVKAISITSVGGSSYAGTVEGTQAISKLSSPAGLVVDAGGNIYTVNLGHNITKIDPQGNLSLIAGATVAGLVNDIGANARFNAPRGIAFDNGGNLIIADSANHVIRKVTLSTGAVTAVAGTGIAGYSDGVASSAQFNSPQAVAVNNAGDIFVVDTNNRRIRKISNGIVTTFAGSGTAGFLDGLATVARFNNPTGIALQNNDLIIADKSNHRIRRVSVINGSLMVKAIAGTGVAGNTDGAPLSSMLSSPSGVTLDTNGNIYVVETGNHKIRKLTSTLTSLTTTSVAGYKDGNEVQAAFSSPNSIFYAAGNLYMADTNNHSIRKIDLSQNYISPEINTISGINIAGFVDGNSSVARFNNPRGMVIDSLGNIYVADTSNHRIRKISNLGSATSFAGSTAGFTDANGTLAQFSSPTDLAIDSLDNIYVADMNNHAIRKISPSGLVSTYAGSGVAGLVDGVGSAAQFKNPRGLSIDSANNLYVADFANNSIRQIAPDQSVTTIAGAAAAGFIDGPGAISRFRSPSDLVVRDDASLIIADQANHALRKMINLNGNWLVSNFSGGLDIGYRDGASIEAQFSSPTGLALASNGAVYVVDRGNNLVRKVLDNGSVTTAAGSGLLGFLDSTKTKAAFNSPEYIVSNSNGDLLLADTVNHRIRKISNLDSASNGSNSISDSDLIVTTIGGALGTSGYRDGHSSVTMFSSPYGMVEDASGNIYVADRNNNRIRKIDSSGTATTIAGTGVLGYTNGPAEFASFRNPSDLVIDSLGNLYVSDYNNSVIRKITPSGIVTTFAGNGVAGFTDGIAALAQFRNPVGLAIDSADNIYVADYNNERIRKITAAGIVTTIAGSSAGYLDGSASTARFNKPMDLIADASGTLYVTDSNNNRIRKISEGIVSTLAGAGSAGYKDGIATEALFYTPAFMAFDANGNILVTDLNNNRIRQVTPNGIVTKFAGSGLPGYKDGKLEEAVFNRPRGILVNDAGEIIISEDSNRIRLITQEDIQTIIVPPLPPLPPIVINPANQAPVIKLINDIKFDQLNNFKILEGTHLKLKIFVFDLEDGISVEQRVRWDSSIQAKLAEAVTELDTAILQVGIHNIVVTVIDSGGLASQFRITLEVVDRSTASSGGVDVNGDGVVDENDTKILNPQSTQQVIVEIFNPSQNILKKAIAKLRAVAVELDTNTQIRNNVSEQIIWELEDPAKPEALREFLAQGPVLKLSQIHVPPGQYNVVARVGEDESKLAVTIKKRKLKLTPKI